MGGQAARIIHVEHSLSQEVGTQVTAESRTGAAGVARWWPAGVTVSVPMSRPWRRRSLEPPANETEAGHFECSGPPPACQRRWCR